ncbi:hypothetical protein [Ornithinibacillus xuwenensis]|uniref:Uncharacterized protein n=1 Tax=Ornithinibacillus xuwenensis TaxID=3144668 RepID=A0ABU9XET0_9BACI
MKKQIYKLKWIVNPYRRDKRTGAVQPVKRSDYAQQLFGVGTGWNK